MNNILWQMSSRHAEVVCLRNSQGEILVEKRVAPQVSLNGRLSWINEATACFREKLHANEVPLAEPYVFEERDGKAIQTSPYVGKDLEVVLREDGSIPLEGLIQAIRGILVLENNQDVGVDTRLSNFCLSESGEVVYVDTFPPLVRFQGKLLVHFPNPTDPRVLQQEFVRKFSPLGILRRLRFGILEQDAGLGEEDLLEAIGQVLGREFMKKVETYFNSLPDHGDLEKALKKMTLEDPDGIRELALRCMPPKGETRDRFLFRIFSLSSNFCPEKLNEVERLAEIRKMLLTPQA